MSANSRRAAEQSGPQGVLLAAAAAMLWGTVGVASEMLPDGVTLSSFHLGFARLAIAAPLLVLFSALVLGRGLWAIGARMWPWIVAVGVLAASYQFCLFVSLEQLGVARTTLLTVCLPPVLIAGASALVWQQRPSAWTTSALLMALGGLMLVGSGSTVHDTVPGAAPLLGLAAGISAAIAFASLSVLARMLARRIHPLQAVSFGFLVGAVLLAPIVVLSGRAGPGIGLEAATTLQLMSVLVYLGTVPTALAYICYFYGMQRSRTATAGIAATLVEPAVAVLLAAGLLGEHLSPAAWLGVACLPFATILLGLEGSRSGETLAGNAGLWVTPVPPPDPTWGQRLGARPSPGAADVPLIRRPLHSNGGTIRARTAGRRDQVPAPMIRTSRSRYIGNKSRHSAKNA
jgi:drug/metabolite transporter, DME family